jgi:L-aminopeptidase/D-esterase-like protein
VAAAGAGGGMSEREAMNHLGHESRAIHAAYAGGAQVAVLPLEFYEAQKEEKVIQFKKASQLATPNQAEEEKKASHA